ncbi:MAG: hypothetical protein HRT57_15190 [Crocinitomicaceae bacterium]|nr:hypothetical protein [Crocinitomicaceae bacterium]
MKTWALYIVLFASLVLTQNVGHAQGCSDPGLCTIGTLNSETTKDSVSEVDFENASLEELMSVYHTREKFRFELNSLYGIGEHDTRIYSLVFKGVIRIKKKMLLNVRIPYSLTNGTLGSNSGFGDVAVSLQNTFFSGKDKRLAATIGIVAPTGTANASDNGSVLPMAYQTTLGSINALIGVSGAYKNWGAAIGYQHSFGKNGNMFYRDNLVTNDTLIGFDPLNEYRLGFPSAQRMKRGNDLMLRLERKFNIGKKFGLVVGVLPIFRLTKTTITLDTGEEEVVLNGTDGITLNVTGGAKYKYNKNWLFRMNFGVPVIARQVRADGLTRKFVGIVSVAYKIW